MQIIISGRHFNVTDEMKAQINERLTAILEHKSLKITTVRVILAQEGSRFLAEVIVNIKSHDIEAKAESYDMNESVETIIDKIEIQVRKYLDKMQDHHREHVEKGFVVSEELEASEEEMIEEEGLV
ncbi:MAG: ribosome-associated translation inhibitor RaiA [Lentisphaerae bacterium]|nr:ribosome-associated translation inhibitor RaiA [Lentisphaerota bacterium]MCP4102300.1 ribosome-associated translation inhibitor RaiA [Lentisphaerota bacterium]